MVPEESFVNVPLFTDRVEVQLFVAYRSSVPRLVNPFEKLRVDMYEGAESRRSEPFPEVNWPVKLEAGESPETRRVPLLVKDPCTVVDRIVTVLPDVIVNPALERLPL